MPVRSVKNNPYSVTGRVATAKRADAQDAESLLEKDFLTLLEFDNRVTRYAVQPCTFRFKDSSGRSRRYTPDVLVEYGAISPYDALATLPPTIFEVKPYAELRKRKQELVPKYQSAREICREYGWRFRVITERNIRSPLLDNARFLLRYVSKPYLMAAAQEVNMEKIYVLRGTLAEMGETTPRELLNRITRVVAQQSEFVPMMWMLLADGAIGCDLSKPLTMASRIWPVENEDAIRRRCYRVIQLRDVAY